MASSTTSNVYKHIMEDVINKVRQGFVNKGSVHVFNKLQETWEMKMMKAEAILGSAELSAGDVPFPPTPLQTPLPTPLPRMATTPLPGGTFHEVKPAGPGRPCPYMQPPLPLGHQRPRLLDVNVGYAAGCGEGDGASHQHMTHFASMSAGKRKRDDFASQYSNGGYIIPQQDGADGSGTSSDELKVGLGSGSSTNGTQVATPVDLIQNGIADDDHEQLNEDDDDEEDDGVLEQGEDKKNINLVMAQFDKVTRSKRKWKCILKDGIVQINNKDILFSKATGEFEF